MKKKVIKTNALRILDQAKVAYQVHEYAFDESHLSAKHVGHETGQDLDRIFKTIVLVGDKTGHLVVCLPASNELDLKHLAKVTGNKRVDLLPLDKLEPLTGYIRGGCSPIGMKKHFPTWIDLSAQEQDTILVSAGKRGLQLEIAPKDLLEVTKASWYGHESNETNHLTLE